MPNSQLQDELKTSKPFASYTNEAYLNLIRTASILQAEMSRFLKARGLSCPQYNVLRILAGAGEDGLPCAEIGTRMVAAVPDITRLIDRLSKAGYVTRERSASDRRVVNVKITPEGSEIATALMPELNELHLKQLGHMTDEDLTALSNLLARCRTPGED